MSPLVKRCIGTPTERCDQDIPIGHKRCAKHTLAIARQDYARRGQLRRDTPQRKVYNTKRWRVVRDAVLARARGQCELCGRPANTADHYPFPLTQLLAQGLDPYDLGNLRALCPHCSGHHDGPRSAEQTTRHAASNRTEHTPTITA